MRGACWVIRVRPLENQSAVLLFLSLPQADMTQQLTITNPIFIENFDALSFFFFLFKFIFNFSKIWY